METGIPTSLHTRIAEWLWRKAWLDPEETLYGMSRDEAAVEIKKIFDKGFQEAIDQLRSSMGVE